MREVGERIGAIDARVREIDEELQQALLRIPNKPHSSVPVGRDAAANQVVRAHGTPREFAFEPKPHWDLGTNLGGLDFERAVREAGSRFVITFSHPERSPGHQDGKEPTDAEEADPDRR